MKPEAGPCACGVDAADRDEARLARAKFAAHPLAGAAMSEAKSKGTKFLKANKVVLMLNGRMAGKKAVIVKTFDEGTADRPYGHCIVAGIMKYPLKITKSMPDKKVAKRSRVRADARPSQRSAEIHQGCAHAETRSGGCVEGCPRLQRRADSGCGRCGRFGGADQWKWKVASGGSARRGWGSAGAQALRTAPRGLLLRVVWVRGVGGGGIERRGCIVLPLHCPEATARGRSARAVGGLGVGVL